MFLYEKNFTKYSAVFYCLSLVGFGYLVVNTLWVELGISYLPVTILSTTHITEDIKPTAKADFTIIENEQRSFINNIHSIENTMKYITKIAIKVTMQSSKIETSLINFF